MPFSNFFFFFDILTLSPTEKRGLTISGSGYFAYFGYKFLHTLFSFFFLLAWTGVILIEECSVLLSYSTSWSNTSMYLLVKFAEKYSNIFYSMVLFQRSTPIDCSSFSVEYNSTKLCTSLLWNSLPLSTHIYSGWRSFNVFSNALATALRDLFFKGTIHPYLENTSIAVNKYFTLSLNFAKDCMSMGSAAQISSMPLTYTILFLNVLVTGLCTQVAPQLIGQSTQRLFLPEIANQHPFQNWPL